MTEGLQRTRSNELNIVLAVINTVTVTVTGGSDLVVNLPRDDLGHRVVQRFLLLGPDCPGVGDDGDGSLQFGQSEVQGVHRLVEKLLHNFAFYFVMT